MLPFIIFCVFEYMTLVFSLMPNWKLPCYPKAENKNNKAPSRVQIEDKQQN